MEAGLLEKAVALAVQADVPVLITGQPGVGKTSFVRALGSALRQQVKTIILSGCAPEDLGGFPTVGEYAGTRCISYLPPQWAVEINQSGGILLLDEFSTARPAVQAPALQLILEARVGQYQLHNVSRVVVQNPIELAPNATPLSAATANRMLHLTWAVNPAQWARGMAWGWEFAARALPVLPPDWRDGITEMRGYLAAFIEATPQWLQVLPKDDAGLEGPWASARTWDMVSVVLAALKAAKLPQDETDSLESELTCGLVGAGPASAFLTWRAALTLPTPVQVLAAPKSFTVANWRSDEIAVILSGLAVHVAANFGQANYLAAWQFLAEVAKAGRKDAILPCAARIEEARKSTGILAAPELAQLREFLVKVTK